MNARPGRKPLPKGEARKHVARVPLTDAEREDVEAVAERDEVSIAEVFRRYTMPAVSREARKIARSRREG